MRTEQAAAAQDRSGGGPRRGDLLVCRVRESGPQPPRPTPARGLPEAARLLDK